MLAKYLLFQLASSNFKPSLYQPLNCYQTFLKCSMSSKTAAACIIGDEILSGKTLDTNSHFLAKSLFQHGIELKRVEVIPDEMQDIISTIQKLKSNYDYIFTSGGIGPTHDDITYDAIAKAFQDTLQLHEPTLQRYQSMSSNPLTPARLRMFTLPSKAQIQFTPDLWVPLCIVENVHILPGVPKLFQAMLQHYLPHLTSTPKERFYRCLIYTAMVEGDLAEPLKQIQLNHLEVKIGSYPIYGTEEDQGSPSFPWKVKLSVVGKDLNLVEHVGEIIAKAVQGEKMGSEKKGNELKSGL